MKILIVAPKFVANAGDFYQFPLGLGYISAVLKKNGHEVRCLNGNHSDVPTAELVDRTVRSFKPDMCATGALSPFMPQVQEIFTAARRAKPEIFNVAGGGVLSSDPEAGPHLMDINAGVIGEGEETIVDLCRTLEGHGDLSRVSGIVFSDNGRVKRTATRPAIMDLGSIPWPDYDGFGFEEVIANELPNDNYFFHTTNTPRSIDMITSRSCPYYCTFCFHPSGKVYRERPLDDFFAELDFRVKRYRVNMVAIIDELFSLKKERLLEFCDRIKPFNVNWMVQLHVNSADENILERMKNSGCTYISYGIESMSQAVLISMKKKSKVERIDDVLRRTHDRKIGIQGNLIFGDTAETLETANETMHWWSNNQRYMVYVNRLQVYPGSPDYIEAVRDGLIKDRVEWIKGQNINLNISRMNDFDAELLGRKIFVAQETLLNIVNPIQFVEQAPLPVRGQSYNVIWDCPGCSHRNDYRGVKLDLPQDRHVVRLTCRSCLSRFDIRTTVAAESPSRFSIETAMKRSGRLVHIGKGVLKRYAAGKFGRKGAWRALAAARTWRRAASLLGDPFDPNRHVAYADTLVREGALGLAVLHYRQALKLDPGHRGATAKLKALENGGSSEKARMTYFVSYSSAPAPSRPARETPIVTARQKRLGVDFPDIQHLEAQRRQA